MFGVTRAVQLDSGQSQIQQFDGDDVGGFLLTTSGSGDVSQVVNNVGFLNQTKINFSLELVVIINLLNFNKVVLMKLHF